MSTAFALGLARCAHPSQETDPAHPRVLDVYYPRVHLLDPEQEGQEGGLLKQICAALKQDPGPLSRPLNDQDLAALAGLADSDSAHCHSESGLGVSVLRQALAAPLSSPLLAPQHPLLCIIPDLDQPPRDAYDAYLRLHLLSHRLIQPHGCNLSGIFATLENVAWTNHGPYLASMVNCMRARWRAQGSSLSVHSVDKFPRMTDYVVPSGVRIADADRVRLGAHLASGTTVMHEGFVNFNAGTLGTSMVEGRISAGVVVGDGSDIGGGASIMGTLSGGGTEVIRVGRNCLLGANAGIGISLGDESIVEAGTYVTAGAKVRCPDGQIVKAASLSGRPGCLFRRNSMDGALEVVFRENSIRLNQALHQN